jgi:hypothetical protein
MPHHRRDAAMPVLRELEPLLEQIRAAGELDPSMPIAERRAQVHAGIDAQAAHMVPPTLIATAGVLGASPGIGAAVARAFAREGAVGSGGSTDWSR